VPEGTHDPRLAAEGELAMARLALDAGDLTHAARHLAGAIVHAPTLPEVHEVLARLAARTDGGLDLFALEPRAFLGTVVARAHLLAAAGRPDEGLELLVAATGNTPAGDWAGVAWVNAPDLPARLDPDRLTTLVMRICADAPDPVPEPLRGPLRPYLLLAGRAVERHPGHGLLLGAASALARRLGEVDRAVDWAARGARVAPSKTAEVFLGYAYRSAGRTEDALAALGRAVEHEPDDLSVYSDIAGTLADDGRLDEALDWVDRALARDPAFDCVVHTAHRLRYQRDGRLEHLVALADFAREHPDDDHDHADLAECCHGQAWLGRVPTATGPAADLLRDRVGAARESGTATPPAPVRLPEPDPPSALRALAAAGLPVTVAGVPEPDIRLPRRTPDRPLWTFTGPVPEPALPPPSAEAVRRLRQLAHPAWPHPPAAYDAAVGLATADLDDLLGLLVHPPEPPGTPLGQALREHDPSLWVRSAQVWACLGLLHHRTDQPWPGSARRRALLELVWGVEDWTTEAALFALVTYAWVEPDVRADVAAVVAARLADAVTVARQRPVRPLRSLAQLALAAPAADPATAATARAVLGGPVRLPAQRRPGRLSRLWRRLTRR
jgi:tetratricopeptide (TPR) repeat protein